MFEHLDPPDADRPDAPRWRDAVARRVRRHRRRRAGAVAAAAGVACVGVLALGALAVDRVQPEQVDVGGFTEEEPPPGEPVTVLFVGVEGGVSSPREGEDGRTDTIVVARVDPTAAQVRLLVVPRDLWVPIAGEGGPGRINTAFLTGGAERLVQTLEGQLGVSPDRYVDADFDGARGIVDALGGLRLSVDHPVTASATGLDLPAGCQVLDGEQTLALGRARKDVQIEQADGQVVVDPSGDFGRQDRAAIIAAALLRAVGEVGPGDLPGLVRQGLGQVRVDQRTTVDDLVDIGAVVGEAEVVSYRLPVTDAVVDGGQQVLELRPGATRVVDAFLEGGPPPEVEGPIGTGPGRPDPAAFEGDATGLALC